MGKNECVGAVIGAVTAIILLTILALGMIRAWLEEIRDVPPLSMSHLLLVMAIAVTLIICIVACVIIVAIASAACHSLHHRHAYTHPL